MTSKSANPSNRLAGETSPYLLQHQHNPVDWYPWGEEAFAAARAQNKPIFLSVGYSTCYWCHVMERQCFENADIAKEMNERFINIKMDREERPDVDQLYMAAVQVLTRHGGWPMSVFLTPDLRPFYGGTYFPPTDMHGRPGFVTVLRGIEDAYRNRHADVEQATEQLVRILGELSQPAGPDKSVRIDGPYIESLIARSTGDYEPTYGGFGMAPKFPRETLLELLLTYTAGGAPSVDPESEISDLKSRILKQVRHTLDVMMYGGIRDQLGGGFHRYSTDAQWLVPHFEIMLYDNAMLAWVYTEAYRQTEDRRYARTARQVLDFVAREMTSPDGAFYTAFDAEVDGQEGLNYLWTREQVDHVLGPEDAKLFGRVYGIDRGANFADPHHPPPGGRPDKNILFVPEPQLLEQNEEALRPLRAKLKSARDARRQPLLDTKILTSWNALMIRAFAYAGQVFGEPAYVDRAGRAAGYLLDRYRNPDGTLIRTRPEKPIAAFLEDYAFLIQALLAVDLAGGSAAWRENAEELAVLMRSRFLDEAAGGFFFTGSDARDLIIRQKTASDSPLPSGNAVAAMVMLELGNANIAAGVIAAFVSQLERGAEGMSSMIQAAQQYVRQHGPIEVAARDKQAARLVTPMEQAAGEVVSITPSWASANELDIRLDIQRPFHIQSNDAAPGLLQTAVAIGELESAKVLAVAYPPGTRKVFPFADEPVSVYEGGEKIRITFDRPPTEKRLRIRLFYQACDEQSCLPQVTKQFELETTGG